MNFAKITLQELKEKEACVPAQEYFKKVFPSGETPVFEWDVNSYLWFMACLDTKETCVSWVRWMVNEGVLFPVSGANLQGANLYRADLQGANLQGANLYRADLQGANLQGANLYRADLREANLQEANLQGANLYRADLQEANLQGANLYRADLQEANLQEANLQGANLQGANLYRADLQGAKYDSYTVFPNGFDTSAAGMISE